MNLSPHLNLSYLLLQTAFSFRHYLDLKKAFDPFKLRGLIQFRPHNLYMHGYISKSYDVKSRMRIGTFHYNFIQNKFKGETINQLFQGGITCWQENINNENYKVILKKEEYEGEGSLSLLFYVNNLPLYFLRFSIGPDLNNTDNTVIHLGTIQGTRNSVEIKKAIDDLNDIYPPKILMTIIESFARMLGIKTIVGVSSENQLSYKPNSEVKKIHFAYESFYEGYGGERNDEGHYLMACPFPQKPLESIKQKHRKRALLKRERLQEISALSRTLLNRGIDFTLN